MMDVKWVLENGLFHVGLDRIAEEIKRQGMEYEMMDYHKDFMQYQNQWVPEKFGSDDCVVCIGSFQKIDCWNKKNPNWISWCNLINFKCSSYFPMFGKYLINNKYVMMPFSEFIRQKHDVTLYLNSDRNPSRWKDMEIFIRPDSGRKTFSGQIFPYSDIENHPIYPLISNDCMVILAPPKKIEKEWRFIVVEERVITGSQYHDNFEIKIESGYDPKAFEFAQIVVNETKYQPDPAYIMDIGKTKEGFGVVEINSFSCSDIYMSDAEIFVKEISNLAKKEYYSI